MPSVSMQPSARLSGRPRVKICCISSVAEARLAIDAGAAALGLVSAMPSGPGVIDEATIAEIATCVADAGVETFLLTSHTDAAAIVAQHRRCRTTTLQLVDALAPRGLRDLRRALPRVTIVQVIHVTGPGALDQALTVAPLVDALLLDSGDPTLAVKQLGGTGRTHDWTVSRAIREQAGVPLWLAGGLHAANVAEAIAAVQPHGLDLCSSVRSEGRLDAARLHVFFDAVNAIQLE